MKRWIVKFFRDALPPVLLATLLAVIPSAASAQSSGPVTAPGEPNVESIDILKENQAERSARQPGNFSPVWRIIDSGANNYSSLPDPEAGVLIQPKAQFPGQARATTAGEAWRQYRNGPLIQIGGWLFIAAVIGVILVYFIFGTSRVKAPPTGRMIERYTPVERITHWTTAITFVILAVSGLTMAFGKYVLLPVFGYALFGWLSYALKTIHNFVGPVFTIALIASFVVFVRDNLPERSDLTWLARLGGLIGKGHVSAGRVNAGSKLWFWGGVVLLGAIISASGFVLDKLIPGMVYTRGDMQIAHIVHLISTTIMMIVSLGHIYMGTVGVAGSYTAMRRGYVDDAWAQQHHDLWYEQIEKGEVPRVRSKEADARVGGPAKAV